MSSLRALFSYTSPLAALLTAAALAPACTSPGGADPGQVRDRLSATLPGLVDPTVTSVNFAGDSTAMAGLTDSLSALDGLDLPFSLSPLGSDSTTTSGIQPAADEGDPSGADLAQQLSDTIFTDANYEGDGIYRVSGDDFCPTDDTGAADPTCLEDFAKADLAIQVELAGDGLDFTLLVGPDRAAPLTLELRTDRASLVADLGEAKDAIQYLAAAFDEEVDLPDVFEGRVAVSLLVKGPQEVAIQLAVRRAVAIEADLSSGHVAFSTAASDPLASLDIDAASRTVAVLLDLGRTRLSAPWSMLNADSLASGLYAIDWQGLSFTASASDGDDSLHIENIGLGDDTSTIKLGDHTLVAVDLNADSGRRYGLTLSPAPGGGLPTATFDPGLDLRVAVDFSPLADAGDAIESWLIDQTYELSFEGDAPTAQAIAQTDASPGALRVASGTLTLSSTAAGAPVVVEAGQCLLPDPVEAGEHPVLGALSAGPCP